MGTKSNGKKKEQFWMCKKDGTRKNRTQTSSGAHGSGPRYLAPNVKMKIKKAVTNGQT